MAKLELTAKTLEGIAKGRIAFHGRLYGGNGLMAEVSPHRTISFALKYRRDGKERRLGLGKWPKVHLEEARRRAVQFDRDVDPKATSSTFRDAADEWLRLNRGALAERTVTQIERYLDACKDAFGDKELRSVKPSDVLGVLRGFEARGAFESAKRARLYTHKVFAWAADPDNPSANPASLEFLKARLSKPRKGGHHAAMPADDIPDFLRALNADNVHPSIRGALTFTVLTALRTGEILGLRWSDVARDRKALTIPAERMKAGEPHVVYLSRQARDVLDAMQPFSGDRDHVFPGRDPRGPLSNMAMLGVMEKKTDATVHGFRSSFSTWANSKKGGDAEPLVVERCLAHVRKDKVAAAYDRHRRDDEARELWQKWADFVMPRKGKRP